MKSFAISHRVTLVRLLSLALSYLLAPAAQANEDDTRFLQAQTRRQLEQQTYADQQLRTVQNGLLYQGQHYQIPNTTAALEPAIYIAINTEQWHLLPDFIARYRLLKEARPALTAMAESLLARSKGAYPLALDKMQQAIALEPEDSRILLELARLWFEDNQDRQALEGFDLVLRSDLPAHTKALIQQYKQALKTRAQWHGSFAIGWGHNNNINQGNGYQSCEAYIPVLGLCAFERNMPKRISSDMMSYELSLQRRFNLRGNHNLNIRPVSYGNYYPSTNPKANASIHDYSYNLGLLQIGYQYLTARQNLSVTPYIEHYYRNRHREYLGYGLQAEWSYSLNRYWQVSTTIDTKQYRYSQAGKAHNSDHKQHDWGATLSYMPTGSTQLYSGINLSKKKYDIAQASSKDWAIRHGIYHAFNGQAGWYINALGIYRQSRQDAHDFFLGERRLDKQQIYILSTGAGKWKLAGFSPEIRLRHTVNHSNIGWAFNYKQTEVSLLLRQQF